MKKIHLLLLFCLCTGFVFAQNPGRIFKRFTEKENQFLVEVNDGTYHIRFFTPEIVETSFIPKGGKQINESYAVVIQPETPVVKAEKNSREACIISKGLKVVIQKQPFQIKYYYKNKEIVSEKRGFFTKKHQPMDMVKDNIKADSLKAVEFNLTNEEVLYGGGARALNMNRRGYRLPLYNRAHYGYETHSELMNYTIPVVLSSRKYIIHFDNAPIGYLDLDSKKENTLTYETISGKMTYQVIAGGSWYDILDSYTDLTGKQPMLPRWALGNFSSRFGYHSQQEVERTIAKFQEEKIPVDAVILDLYWFGKELKGTMGNFEVFRDSFPDMPQMIKNLQQKEVKTVLITEPFVLKTSKKWNEAAAENVLAKDTVNAPARYDFYFGNTGIIDIFSTKGRQWFRNIYTDLFKMGVAGIWGDLGEPEVLPSWVKFAKGTADELHNVYGHNWAKLVYDAFKNYYPNQRPFILMRAGYSGSQRYGMVPWSGDVNRSWGGLQSQPKISLQMGLQGLAYMHSDLGGFAGNLNDDELYVRWLQYGVFQPVFRPHAQEEVPSEPVFRSEKSRQLAKKAIELRYQLLPYNYQLMFENHRKGTPLMRPVFMTCTDANLTTYTNAYLWGKDIWVAPVLEKGQQQKEIYFPKNAIWFDFYTNKKITGGQTKNVTLYEDRIPVYVRAGAFIPMAQPMQNTVEYDADKWTVHFFADRKVKHSENKFYNDNGITANAFEKVQYEQIIFRSEQKRKQLVLTLSAEIGANYKARNKTYTFVIHGLEKAPKSVKAGYKKIKGNWNKSKKELTFKVDWNSKYNCQVIISN